MLNVKILKNICKHHIFRLKMSKNKYFACATFLNNLINFILKNKIPSFLSIPSIISHFFIPRRI